MAEPALHKLPSTMAPPSRPQKSPTPRFSLRRSPRRSSSSSSLLKSPFKGGQENNDSDEKLDGSSKQKSLAKPFKSSSGKASKSKARIWGSAVRQKMGRQKKNGGKQSESTTSNTTPNAAAASPTKTISSVCTSTPSPPSSSSKNKEVVHDPFAFVDDDELVTLTPRNLAIDDGQQNTFDDDGQVTLTPPVSCTPLFVSAKKHGSQVRQKNYATKRRRPDDDGSSPENDNEEDYSIPEGLSPAQRAKEYWKRCYGEQQPQELLLSQQTSWSAKRAAPAKSCLSHSKPKRSATAHIMLPPTSALMVASPPLAIRPNNNNNSGAPVFSTPQASPDDPNQTNNHSHQKCSHSKSVQFGVTQAAEYDRDEPSAKFTPLPAEYAQERFPLTANEKEQAGEEIEIAETKENSSVLAEWEDDFDALVEDDDDDDDDPEQTSKPRKRHSSSKRQRSNRKHRKRDNSDRRKSTSFCSPRNNGGPLYDPTNDDEEELTPENPSLMVLDNLAAFQSVVESPSTAIQPSEQQSESIEEVTSVALSPVVARKLSSESMTGLKGQTDVVCNMIVSQEEELEKPSALPESPKPEIFPLTSVNIWGEAATNPSFLENDEDNWDLQAVATNLAFWPYKNAACANKSPGSDAVSTAWHSTLSQSVRNALDTLPVQPEPLDEPVVKEDDYSQVPQELREHWERLAQKEWEKVELELCQTLAREFVQVKQKVTKKSAVLGSVVLPAKASLEPTRKHLAETEADIRRLESLVKKEEDKKIQLQRRYERANVQSQRLQAAFSRLAYHAIGYLSPMEVAVTQSDYQAVIHQLMEGWVTRVELDGSMQVAVSQNLQLEQLVGSDNIAKFYEGLLRSGPGKLQEGILQLLLSKGDVDATEILPELASLLGRTDLAALGLQQVASQYDVSVSTISEEGEPDPVLVVKVLLPQGAVLNAFFRRSNTKSVFWALPSDVSVERDGKSFMDLSATLTGCRSLSATAGFLQSACNEVLEHLKKLGVDAEVEA